MGSHVRAASPSDASSERMPYGHESEENEDSFVYIGTVVYCVSTVKNEGHD